MRNLDKTWQRLHNQAILHPQGDNETAIVHLHRAICCLDHFYREKYHSAIGEDGVLCVHFEEILRGFRGLLNMELGRLDSGSLDSFIQEMADKNGLEID